MTTPGASRTIGFLPIDPPRAMKSIARFFTAAVPAILLICTAAAAAQSLGDVAKKEEERRKGIKAPTKVYTNSDLKSLPPATATATPADPAKPAPSADSSNKKEGDKDRDASKDRAYWTGRFKELQSQLTRDETYAEALQTRINSLNNDFYARDDPAQRSAIAQNKQKAIDELNRLKQSIQNDKKAIIDLQEEARKAGVPAGWLRS